MGLSTPSSLPEGLRASHACARKSLPRYASFTLIEILVGVTIFSLLALMLLSITSAASTLWEQESAKEEGFREARAALNTLSHDLSGAVVTTNTAWFYSNTNTVSQLAFLTTMPNGAQPTGLNNSDICAVGYSLEYTTNDAGSAAQKNVSLYRYVAFSGWTYTNIISGGDPVNNLFSNVDGTNVIKNLIARNVTQFTFTGYTNDAGTLQPEADAILPQIVDINVTAVNDRAAQQLTSQAMWQNSSSSIIVRNQETFNLRADTVPQ